MTIPIRKLMILVLLLVVCAGCKSQIKKNPADDSLLPTMDISSKFIENKHSGKLFAIVGNIQNNYPNPRGKIRVRCKLYTDGMILARQDSVYAGVIVSDDELRTGSVREIKKRLNTPQQSPDFVTNVLPGQKLPFIVVFADLPPDLDEFALETISSVQVNDANTGRVPDRSPQKIADSPKSIPIHERRINELVQRTENAPDDLEAWTQLGNLYFDTDQKLKAIQSYEKSLALGPDQEDVWIDLGVMYRRNSQPEKAVQCFDRALTIKVDHQIALYNKGIVLIQDLNDLKGATTTWQKLVRVNPQARTPRGDLVKDLIIKLQGSK